METQIIGNVGQDAEVKANKENKEYAVFSVADSTKRGGQEQTVWVTCYYGNKNVAQYLKKGTKVFVRGDLQANIYTTKTGENKIGFTLFVNKLEFCGGGQSQPSQQQPAAQDEPKDLPF